MLERDTERQELEEQKTALQEQVANTKASLHTVIFSIFILSSIIQYLNTLYLHTSYLLPLIS